MLFIVYATTAVIWFLFCVGLAALEIFVDNNKKSAKTLIKAALLSPMWPIVIIWFVKNTGFPKE